MKLGSPQADAAYDRQFNREADKYFAPQKLYCQCCEEVVLSDDDVNYYCTECNAMMTEES